MTTLELLDETTGMSRGQCGNLPSHLARPLQKLSGVEKSLLPHSYKINTVVRTVLDNNFVVGGLKPRASMDAKIDTRRRQTWTRTKTRQRHGHCLCFCLAKALRRVSAKSHSRIDLIHIADGARGIVAAKRKPPMMATVASNSMRDHIIRFA
uniref:Uncharacterized protein n=1 Tax=Steinernema glaseri TaxID=37863 RepID=A0A1I7ZV30_9BILA